MCAEADGLAIIAYASRPWIRRRASAYDCSMTATISRRVLIAEDDRAVRDSLERTLRLEGFDVESVRNGSEAVDACMAERPDLVILDVMMPEMDGLTACLTLRPRYPELPILMLTARHEVGDRVAGLDAGADDYLVKPYASVELLARVRALLRRGNVSEATSIVRLADLKLDPTARLAWRSERLLDLTKTEFDLLELLMWNAGVVLSRTTLYERVWGYDFETSSRSLDVYIGYLRTKLELNGETRLLKTVRGTGYVVREA